MKKQKYNEVEGNRTIMKRLINYIIFVLFLLIIVLVLISIYALAKYSSSKNQNASADIARWSFKVNGNGTQSANNINFSITRTDNNRFC